MLTHKEERWTLVFKWAGSLKEHKGTWRFAGKYCFKGGTEKEPIIRTYKTRKEARAIKDKYGDKFVQFKVVKVSATIKEISSRKE